ncbi:hypothetical protein MNEG_8215 [Monoraphidium neglectum]|uniref:Uncharacterized protein n=1 Tax=Monoraphidium neglectum TaxID=145388 RepID=A0A0D2MGA0_9CHLO|nr:hypothetical protein MNEG_8215 [Monoraphidium neglectum]KIY99746.1 hypothetical protein MNEG_8215 [Monoraphidium neglectum]|eukprot:XP_013898766.1 hypothetical protein MNEG_8215 [Monoraphidium neglectum]
MVRQHLQPGACFAARSVHARAGHGDGQQQPVDPASAPETQTRNVRSDVDELSHTPDSDFGGAPRGDVTEHQHHDGEAAPAADQQLAEGAHPADPYAQAGEAPPRPDDMHDEDDAAPPSASFPA